jgi:hypothetical protein
LLSLLLPQTPTLTDSCRWPTILTGIIDELARINGSLLATEDADKVKESKELISKLAELIYEMRHDRELPLLPGEFRWWMLEPKQRSLILSYSHWSPGRHHRVQRGARVCPFSRHSFALVQRFVALR